MRVLVLTDHWEPDSNVPQRRWEWLSHILLSQGHQVCIATPNVEGTTRLRHRTENTTGRVVVVRTAGRKGSSSLTSRSIAQMRTAVGSIVGIVRAVHSHEVTKPDLIIGTVPGLPTATVTRVVAALLRVPFGLDVRDAWPDLLDFSADWNSATGHRSTRERIFSAGFRRLAVPVVRCAMLYAYSRARFIWTTSDRFASDLRLTLAGQKNRPRIAVVRNVFPQNRTVPEKASAVDRNEFRVIYAGKIGRAQKLNNAIEAARLAQEQGVPLKLRFIGAGVAVNQLKELSESLGAHVDFYDEMTADELSAHYRWADSALVHLADWEPLAATVPSKTFDLMSSQIHITGVVEGETAQMLRSLSAGHTVSPGKPEELAALWCELWKNPELLHVPERAREWVIQEREIAVPNRIRAALAEINEGKTSRE